MFIIAYSLSFSIIRLLALVCLEIAMHNEQFHSFVQFIHSFFQQGTMHTCHLWHTHDIVQSYLLLLLLLFFIPSLFFSYSYASVCSIVIENLFKTRIYILRAHTHTYQYCHIYLCVHNFLPPFSLKYLSRFIHDVIYNFFSSFIVHILWQVK